MYWAIKQIYKAVKPKINNIAEQKGKLESLEKRIELLEERLGKE